MLIKNNIYKKHSIFFNCLKRSYLYLTTDLSFAVLNRDIIFMKTAVYFKNFDTTYKAIFSVLGYIFYKLKVFSQI